MPPPPIFESNWYPPSVSKGGRAFADSGGEVLGMAELRRLQGWRRRSRPDGLSIVTDDSTTRGELINEILRVAFFSRPQVYSQPPAGCQSCPTVARRWPAMKDSTQGVRTTAAKASVLARLSLV